MEITSHLDSGLYYIFNQDESLRTNSVGLFDYNTDGLHYYRIDISHGHELNTTVSHMRTILRISIWQPSAVTISDGYYICKDCGK